jgi:hypothetical protein
VYGATDPQGNASANTTVTLKLDNTPPFELLDGLISNSAEAQKGRLAFVHLKEMQGNQRFLDSGLDPTDTQESSQTTIAS